MSETVYPLAGAAALERRGLRDRVYDLVLDMLMTADLAPGTRLSIDAIARDLKVSPTPVREALVQLERTGLVVREALKGYRVAPPLAAEHLEALFDARLVLECGATELAARHAQELVPLLEQALTEHIAISHVVDEAVDEGEKLSVGLIRDYFAVDWNFHHLIFEGTRNPFLLDMSEAISTRVHRMRQTVKSGVSDADEAVIEHGAILEAFRSGDGAAAGRAMRDHIERVRERARKDVAAAS
ncbi:GntR family transcriptional regulator [Sinomonas cellulolyticus]|uniref:GntR family transcriptional regulator n=1 Tax=Sinomonas cellulolyticus TaxID=2801916 RepID=A0ABS1K223_9MICC|nr:MULTISPECIES: GntR family transcriptional regulator [Sinomonas]MBL0705580.1 GntR family transcriptional regulator [Sinomonas cellulolyticus]GHG51428.1 GntR family transcriptional regulator [Sinomonas sp. KCTC 49339]